MPLIPLSDFLRGQAAALGAVIDKQEDRAYASELYKYQSHLTNRAAHLEIAGRGKAEKKPPHLIAVDVPVCPECGNTKPFGCARACSLQTSARFKRATRRVTKP